MEHCIIALMNELALLSASRLRCGCVREKLRECWFWRFVFFAHKESRARASTVNLITWSLAFVVLSFRGMKEKWNFHSVFVSRKENVKCEARNSINFHFGKRSMAEAEKSRTHLYLPNFLPFICVSQPFFTLENHTAASESAHSDIPPWAYYAKRSCKGAFYGQMFYFSFVVAFLPLFIQLVSHHTCTREYDMEWLQFHLIATQTAQNHITFICYSISPDDERYSHKKIAIMLLL